MNSRTRSRSQFALVLACALPTLATIDSVTAQAPKGHVVVAAFNPGPWNPHTGQTGGLFVAHPRNPGQWITVQNLSPELATPGPILSPNGGAGANAILALPNGDLLVGEIWWSPAPGDRTLDVHQIRLVPIASGGYIAMTVRKYPIAAPTGSDAGINDLELLPTGDVLLAVDGDLAPPMTGAILARLDLNTGTVTPVDPGRSLVSVNALAVSADGRTAYLGEWISQSGGRVWDFPLPNGRATPLATVPSGILAMDRDNAGDLVVGCFGGAPPPGLPPNLFRVDTTTGSVTTLLPNVPGVRNAVVVERNTGALILCRNVDLAWAETTTQTQTMLVQRAGWGVLAGLEMIPAVESFGTQHGGAAPYEWQTSPNPGGLPLIGNAGFSVTLTTTTAPACSWVFFATRRLPAAQAWPPLVVLIDPLTVIYGAMRPGARSMTVAAPIPNDPTLVGLPVFAQSFHTDASGWVSSPGVCITIL